MSNAKNEILEWLQSLGWPRQSLSSERHTAVPPHRVTAILSVPPLDLLLVAEAEDQDKTRADVAACEIILAELRARRAELFVEADSLFSDAQTGDALIKLAIYGWEAPLSPSQRTSILQRVESDRSLAGRLDEFAGDGDWSRKFGPGVGRRCAPRSSRPRCGDGSGAPSTGARSGGCSPRCGGRSASRKPRRA